VLVKLYILHGIELCCLVLAYLAVKISSFSTKKFNCLQVNLVINVKSFSCFLCTSFTSQVSPWI